MQPLETVETRDATRVATFERYESQVRRYCRHFPAVFARGEGVYLYDEHGRRWLDFLSGAGSLNYGHNHPALTGALVHYIEGKGVVNTLDLYTVAKERFLASLNDIILQPRGLNYRCQCCGPTGADAVEAALKLARKATGRSGLVAFSSSYHGMTDGALSVSTLPRAAGGAYYRPTSVTFLPFEGVTTLDVKTDFTWIRAMLKSKGNGIERPAAFIVELVQAEGGVNIATRQWVQELYLLSRELEALFIVDEIQSGCGRTGPFFSFEAYDVVPDAFCVSKSISGLGLPMSLLLIRPECDVWAPGEHTGTFRGFGYSFVTGAAAFGYFWTDAEFVRALEARARELREHLVRLQSQAEDVVTSTRSVGLMAGVTMVTAEAAAEVQRRSFEEGLIVETCGPDHNVLKLLPPLVVTADELASGMQTLAGVVNAVRHDL